MCREGKKKNVFCISVDGSPMEVEDDDDHQEGEDIGENPHQAVLFWTLMHRHKSVL